MDDPDLKTLFMEESRKYLDALEAGSAGLDGAVPLPGDLKELIRYAHSMKGMAATMGFAEIARESARIEEALRDLQSGARTAGPGLRAGILASLGRARALVAEYGGG